MRRGRLSMRCRLAAARGRQRALLSITRQGMCPVQNGHVPTVQSRRTVVGHAAVDVAAKPAAVSNARTGFLLTVAASLFS